MSTFNIFASCPKCYIKIYKMTIPLMFSEIIIMLTYFFFYQYSKLLYPNISGQTYNLEGSYNACILYKLLP